MQYQEYEIVRNEEVAPSIYNMFLDGPNLNVLPGQFVMVWIPEKEEVPMAPSMFRNLLRITYKVVGETTKYMAEMGPGDLIYLRGPLGKGFELDTNGKYLLLAGGVGAAPIIYAAKILGERKSSFTYVEGEPSYKYKLFVEEARSYGGKAILYTEDGSGGKYGYPTDYLREYGGDYDYILACGPEAMNKTVYNICNELGLNCQISMERIVKCGVGVCGSCVVEPTGLLVCRDGPVFSSSILREYGYDC